MRTYTLTRSGDGGPGSVYRPDGTELTPDRSQEIINKSPTGFSWGYQGSGPHQLALALLLDHTDDRETAIQNYHDFTVDVISHIDDDEAEIPLELIDDWLSRTNTSTP